MENRNIIIILVAIIVILLALIGMAFLQMNAKKESNLIITSDSTLNEQDSILIQLTDLNKNPISNGNVDVKILDKDGKVVVEQSVQTDSKGNAKMDFNLNPGEYSVEATFGGNNAYDQSSTTQNLLIKEKVVEASLVSSSQSSSSSSSSGNPYDINNLPPSNDPNPETKRFYIDENHVRQEYSDNYFSIVDLRTGERHGGFF